MLRQNRDSNKRGLGLTKPFISNFFPISNRRNCMWRHTRNRYVRSMSAVFEGFDRMIKDPDYIMQLVNDVRTFADVLLNLRESICSGVSDASW